MYALPLYYSWPTPSNLYFYGKKAELKQEQRRCIVSFLAYATSKINNAVYTTVVLPIVSGSWC